MLGKRSAPRLSPPPHLPLISAAPRAYLQGNRICRRWGCLCPVSLWVPLICVPHRREGKASSRHGSGSPCSGREDWFGLVCIDSWCPKGLVWVGILDGEGEGIFAVWAPGLDHQAGVGKAALGAALGVLEAQIVSVSFFSWVSAGWGWAIPFLPPSHPPWDHRDFLCLLHSPPLPTASLG